MRISIPESVTMVELLPPAADAAGRTSAKYPSLKHAKKAWIVAFINQGNAATVQLDPKQATKVDGTGTKALTGNVPIWVNQDLAAATAFARQANAKTFTPDAAVKHKMVIFEIDPTQALDVAGGFDCIGLTTGASNAANITSAFLAIDPKFKGDDQPDYLTD
jgi:hypothetical protein